MNRKVLVEAVKDASEYSHGMTDRSLNHLPEYFMSVKVAEYLWDKFRRLTFSMEDNLVEVFKEVGINDTGKIPAEYRADGLSRVDLVVRNYGNKKIRHIIEFKRSLNTSQIKKDVERLTWISANSPERLRLNKNYLIAVTHRKPSLFEKRTKDIEGWASNVSNDVTVRFSLIDLSEFKSTHPNGNGRSMYGGVWEFLAR